MGPPQSLLRHAPEVADYSWLTSALCQCVDSQECLASHNDGDEAEEEDEHPVVGHHLHKFWRFITDTLLDYVPQLDPSGHAPCSIMLASLDHSFQEEHRSCTIDLQVQSALPLGPLLLGVQSFLDHYLLGHCAEDPVYDVSGSLTALKLSHGNWLERECGFCLTQPKMFGYDPQSYRVWALKQHWESYLVVPPVGDHDFPQFSSLSPFDLHPTVKASMVNYQLKMLSYMDYTLAVGLRSIYAIGTDATDSAACKR